MKKTLENNERCSLIVKSVIKLETNFPSQNVLIKLKLFLSLSQHSKDQNPSEGHILQLVC